LTDNRPSTEAPLGCRPRGSTPHAANVQDTPSRYAPGFAAPFNGCHGPRPCANHRSATILSHSQLILKKASGIATVAAIFPQSDRCPMGLRCRDRARAVRAGDAGLLDCWIAGVCRIAGTTTADKLPDNRSHQCACQVLRAALKRRSAINGSWGCAFRRGGSQWSAPSSRW